jgi:molecular chaperone Hsp33
MLARVMSASDHLVRAISREAHIRVVAALTTNLVAEATRRHQLSPAATCAVGRALTSSLLLATLTKGEERVTVQILGDGPLGSVTADATGRGDVRGYALHPETVASLPAGRPMIADIVGRRGVINVVRDLGLKELYQGQTSLVTGEIDEDVEAYLRTSEQVPSALGCEVVLDEAGVLMAAGGVLVQALPGGDTAAVREAQHALRTGRLHHLLASGEHSAQALAEALYSFGPIEVVGEERAVRFHCRCSPERIADTLRLLGTIDLDEMIAEDKPAEVVCNFCNTRYHLGRTELERIRAQAAGGPRESN